MGEFSPGHWLVFIVIGLLIYMAFRFIRSVMRRLARR